MRVALLQCELEHRHQAPHLAGALFARDLRAAGHEVTAALVHPTALEEAAAAVLDHDLLVLDSIFPFALTRRLRELTRLPALIGGHNALQHLLRGPADFALTGSARRTLRAAVEAATGSGRAERVPGLWFRRPDGRLDCGPSPTPASPKDELLPFEPDLDWSYFGPPRAPGSNLRVPSVVAELGCVYDSPVLADGGPYEGTRPRAPDPAMTERAAADFHARFASRDGGCTFCTFRYLPHRRHRADEAIALLERQVRALHALGARGFSLQTENPFPYLGPLLARLEATGLAGGTDRAIDEIHIRTIPWLLLRRAEELVDALATARRLGLRVVLGQVGFEAFDDEGLALFHKGLSATENRRAARLLGELEAEHGDCFTGTRGHGFIALHPWTTPEGLRANLAACREDAPWLLPDLHPARRLELYNEWTPLFWKAQDEGLLREAPDAFGWDWRFADPRTHEAVAVTANLLREPGVSSAHAPDLLEAVLDIQRDEPDPARRRPRYLTLRLTLR